MRYEIPRGMPAPPWKSIPEEPLPNGTDGSPRMHRDLIDDVLRIARDRTARLMRENGLVARQKQRFKQTGDNEHAWPDAANLTAQDRL